MREKAVRQLYGRDFEIVKEGLSESQVMALVTELVDERDMLLQRQEHLLSLTKLAEKTVAEADKLAEDIKREVEEETRIQATKILAKAEQEAQEIMEQKQAEILADANREAQAIKASAQKEAELLISQHKQRAQEAVKEMVQKLHNQLISELKGVMEHATALRAEWESKLSEPIIDSLPPEDSEPPSASVPVAQGQGEEIAPPTTLESDLEHKCDVLEQLEKAWVDTDAAGCSEEQSLTTQPETSQQPHMGREERATEAVGGRGVPFTYEGTVELDILPPVTPSNLVEIQSYLRRWPGIGISELRPNENGCSITVILEKPIQLIDILKQWPGVEDVRECAADKAETLDGVTPSKNGLRRIAITVSGNK